MTAASQNRAIATIRPLLPPDAEERVTRLVKQANQAMREQIRTETGLRLVDRAPGEAASRSGVPVRVIDGFSPAFADLIDRHADPVLWALVAGQSRLGRLIDGLNFLLELWPRLSNWEHLPGEHRDADAELTRTRTVAEELQQVAVARQLVDKIRRIEEDILGCYQDNQGRPHIEIYWMPVAIVASMLELQIEDLALVVLAHELAHAYTHIGRDIDGREWDSRGFFASDRAVTEGLAQHYAQAVAHRLRQRYPMAPAAFEGLLSLQSGPYLAHREWEKLYAGNGSETVRFAMLVARSRGKVSNAEWLEEIRSTAARLKGGRSPRPASP